jgi:hypothetical protein
VYAVGVRVLMEHVDEMGCDCSGREHQIKEVNNSAKGLVSLRHRLRQTCYQHKALNNSIDRDQEGKDTDRDNIPIDREVKMGISM